MVSSTINFLIMLVLRHTLLSKLLILWREFNFRLSKILFGVAGNFNVRLMGLVPVTVSESDIVPKKDLCVEAFEYHRYCTCHYGLPSTIAATFTVFHFVAAIAIERYHSRYPESVTRIAYVMWILPKSFIEAVSLFVFSYLVVFMVGTFLVPIDPDVQRTISDEFSDGLGDFFASPLFILIVSYSSLGPKYTGPINKILILNLCRLLRF